MKRGWIQGAESTYLEFVEETRGGDVGHELNQTGLDLLHRPRQPVGLGLAVMVRNAEHRVELVQVSQRFKVRVLLASTLPSVQRAVQPRHTHQAVSRVDGCHRAGATGRLQCANGRDGPLGISGNRTTNHKTGASRPQYTAQRGGCL